MKFKFKGRPRKIVVHLQDGDELTVQSDRMQKKFAKHKSFTAPRTRRTKAEMAKQEPEATQEAKPDASKQGGDS